LLNNPLNVFGIIQKKKKYGTNTSKPKGDSLKPKKSGTEEAEFEKFYQVMVAASNKEI